MLVRRHFGMYGMLSFRHDARRDNSTAGRYQSPFRRGDDFGPAHLPTNINVVGSFDDLLRQLEDLARLCRVATCSSHDSSEG